MIQPLALCELCGLAPIADPDAEPPDPALPLVYLLCRSCTELVVTGRLMIEKHGFDHVRQLVYRMFEDHWWGDAD